MRFSRKGASAEMYTILIQDGIQGMHWNNQKCSLNPVGVYYHNSDQTKSCSLYSVSDNLMHNLDFVCMIIKETVAFVKNFILSYLSMVPLFS